MSSNRARGARSSTPLREQHTDATRRAILSAARQQFAAKGYAGTSLDAIVAPAGVTKGALYHHFKDKAAVLEAVYIEMEEELAVQVKAAVMACRGNAWDRMRAAVTAFFAASAVPAYTRIILRDAPLVLDAHHGHEIDQAIGLGLVAALVTDFLGEAGRSLPVMITARILLAAVSEVAIAMAHADAPARVRREGTAVVIAMLEGLRAAPTKGKRRRTGA